MICRTFIPALATMFMLLQVHTKVCATDPDARDVADKFLAHMSANSPVAGKFRIETIPNPNRREEFRKKAQEAASKQGYTIGFEPDQPVLDCRWAWDGAREMLEALSGSNVGHTFFKTPEALLKRSEGLSYNLDKPMQV